MRGLKDTVKEVAVKGLMKLVVKWLVKDKGE